MKRYIYVLVGAVVLSVATLAGAATLYVDGSGSATPPYDSWATAATTIHDAVDASGVGDTIVVNDGTYDVTSSLLLSNIVLRSANGAEATVIVNERFLGLMIEGSNALIHGFSITGMRTNAVGIGLGNGATMDSCRIYNNHAIADGSGAGGIYVMKGTVQNTLIYSNTVSQGTEKVDAKVGGGALMLDGVLSNCQVFANTVVCMDTNCEQLVGGVLFQLGTMYNCDIANNIATGKVSTTAGGVYYDYGVTIIGTTVRDNKAYSGYVGTNDVRVTGGISGVGDVRSPCPLFRDCSIVSNYAEQTSTQNGGAAGGVLAQDDDSRFTNLLVNCSIAYNRSRIPTNSNGTSIGGIYANHCRLTNVNIIANEAYCGKGTAVGGYGCERDVKMMHVRINDNRARATSDAFGGLMMNDGEVESTYIQNNRAVDAGECIGGFSSRGAFLRSVLVSENSADTTGSAAIGGGHAGDGTYLASCTFAGNVASNATGNVGGVAVRGGEAWNSIFYANTGAYPGYPSDPDSVGDGKNVYEAREGATHFMSCCFPTVNAITNGVGNLTVDPKFIRADAGNYRLLHDSLCRDTGVTQTWMNGATDVVGLPRVFGGMLDRGAYEYLSVNNDFDGDGISDVGCYFAEGGNWYIDKSMAGFWTGILGYAGTDPVTGDFDGDGLCDYGFFYPPTGLWEIERSSQGRWNTSFGYAGTVPVTGDFDGDSTYDFGCYSAPNGDWYIYRSTSGFWHNQFGYAGTIPVTGDFDGDGVTDFGCYYPPIGGWYIYKSKTKSLWVNNFGYEGTVPITGDFDGDGICDFGCYHAEGGYWYIYKSLEGFWVNRFGYAGTIAITGDYDGDGVSDFGCYYPTGGNWYIYKSTDGFWTTAFGYEGTTPIGR